MDNNQENNQNALGESFQGEQFQGEQFQGQPFQGQPDQLFQEQPYNGPFDPRYVPNQQYQGQQFIPNQPAMKPPKPPKKPKEPMSRKKKKIIIISAIIAAVLIATVVVFGLISPTASYIKKNIPKKALSYNFEINGDDEKRESTVSNVEIVDSDYGFFGGEVTAKVTFNDDYFERESEITFKASGIAFFWDIESFKFEEDFDVVKPLEGFRAKLADKSGVTLSGKYVDDSAEVFDDMDDAIDISMDVKEQNKYQSFDGEVTITGEVNQYGSHRKRDIVVSLYTDKVGDEVWTIEGNYSDGSSESDSTIAVTVDSEDDMYAVGVYSKEHGYGASVISGYSTGDLSGYDLSESYYVSGYIDLYDEDGNMSESYINITFYPNDPPKINLDYEGEITAKESNFYVDPYKSYIPVRTYTGSVTLPEVNSETLTILYSDSDLEDAMDLFFEKYPEYSDLVELEYVDAYSDLADESSADSTVNLHPGLYYVEPIYMNNASDRFLNLSEVGLDENAFGEAYDYTINRGTVGSNLKYMSFAACPGGFFYKKDIAERVFGTSDPEEIGSMMSTWDGFIEMAEKLDENDCYMLSSYYDLAAGMGLINEYNSDRSKSVLDQDILSRLEACDAIRAEGIEWTEEWDDDFYSDNVFGYFGCTWMPGIVNMYIEEDGESEDYGICTPPQGYCWGGTYFGISDNCPNQGLAALIIYTLCNDTELMYDFYDIDYSDAYYYRFPNNQTMAEEMVYTMSYDNYFAVGDPYKVFCEVAKETE